MNQHIARATLTLGPYILLTIERALTHCAPQLMEVSSHDVVKLVHCDWTVWSRCCVNSGVVSNSVGY